MHDLDLTISDISKIEGKASCIISVRNGELRDLKFSIAEYKRFYTQAIRGKDIVALPQLTSRICGTCSNAHLLCALKAAEKVFNIKISKQTEILRKLLNYALIIRDHALHLYIFVLPDFFNKDSLLDFDENNPEEHKYLFNAFSIKAVGNELAKAVGGRSVHAPYLTIGGFLKLPDETTLMSCYKKLIAIRSKVIDIIDLFYHRDMILELNDITFSSVIDDELSFINGIIKNSDGNEYLPEEYGKYLQKVKVDHSQATAYYFKNKNLLLGALSRLNLAKNNLNLDTISDTEKYLKVFPSKNIFHNNLAQAIEILHAVDSSIKLLGCLKIQQEKPVTYLRKKGESAAVIDAPRGTLFYKIKVDDYGKIIEGSIIVPTGVNQTVIELSIRKYIQENISRINDKNKLERIIERIVRSFDPCMSCATHFLKFRWKKS
jgi:coenzyme F420-reducing hydrogenase alpha subunit